MSGEYFTCDNVSRKSTLHDNKGTKRLGEMKVNENCRSVDDLNCDPSELKLHVIEKQLGQTENRCNTLKEQLNYMKKYCEDINGYPTNQGKPPKFKQNAYTVINDTYTVISDTSDPNVRTINNILSGLTNSVNRLSALQVDIDAKQMHCNSKKSYREIACGDDDVVVTTDGLVNSNNLHCVNVNDINYSSKIDSGAPNDLERKLNGSSIIRAQRPKKRLRLKPSRPMKNSTTLLSKSKIIRDKSKLGVNTCNTTLSNTTNKKSKFAKRFKYTDTNKPKSTSNLVELYHNNKAVNKSDSDDSCQKNKATANNIQVAPSNQIDNIPLLPISDVKMNFYQQQQQQQDGQNLRPHLSPIGEHEPYDKMGGESTTGYMKNYELPTIASKLKQVAKGYMRGFDFRTIPFCAARSTSPSHNIGINIQQVMSIMKTRQPINGISPTLAHNIGIAAEKLQNNPLSAIVSTLGSRLGIRYGRSQCPLMRYHSYNYNNLQDMAKDIPEEQNVGDVVNENESQYKNGQQINYSGPSGDNEAQQYGAIWTVDPTNQRNCTCVPYEGVGFQQVYNKYSSNSGSRSTFSCIRSGISRVHKYRTLRNNMRYAVINQKNSGEVVAKVSSSKPLKCKQKTLKEVLENLHTEFEQLNNKYDELNRQVDEGAIERNNDVIKELEILENNLTNKENEINMVMDLYKEVSTLKEQVKTLKEKASSGSVAASIQLQPRREREQNTALHLTKLLRQIQHYQGLYK